MKEILEIIKAYPFFDWRKGEYNLGEGDIQNMATEIESLIKENYVEKEFVEWYVTEGQFEYRFWVGQVPNPLAEALDYWQINIKDK